VADQLTSTGTPRSRLDRLAARAGFAIAWDKLWPVAVAVLSTFGLFLAVSFLGLWLELPRWGRMVGIGVFALLLIASLAPLIRFRLASRSEQLARLDADSGLPHRPATALDDRLANGSEDLATRALWDLHRRRAEQAASRLKVSLPSPRLARRDRYALRGLVVVALVAAAFVAGPEKYARTLAAFDWHTVGALSQGYRLDAWIDPPAYTGKPPVVLNLKEADAKVPHRERAPAGSIIIVRASESANVTLDAEGSLVPVKADDSTTPAVRASTVRSANATDTESRWTLKGDSRLVVKRFGSPVAVFELAAIPDKPPTIALKDQVKQNSRGSMTLAYQIDDDYGVVGAEASFAKPVVAGRAATGRSLAEAPKVTLALPAMPGGLGEAETTADLSDHPWAGARVTMTLSAKDEGGNEGLSDPVEVTLPQRPFVKPLARALVEQRRNLVLAPDDRSRVQTAIDALMIAPDEFNVSPSIYLGLSAIAARLKRAKTDPQLLEVADLLWEMALQIEDGGLSDAERDLRAAQQQLRDALNRGASDDEIKKLMDQMRAALDKFLNELAQQAMRDQQNNPDSQRNAQNDNSRTVTPRDLQSMLDQLEQMMRNGQMADAQRMMDQLQRMLENLQSARRQRNQDPMAREMNRSLDELDALTREEQQLRDDTYRDQQKRQRAQRNRQGQQGQPGTPGQRQRGQQQRGQQQPGDEGDEGDDETAQDGQGNQQGLQERQQALRQRLEQLQRRMKDLGADPKDGLDDAGNAMADAENELGQGDGQGKAVDSQGRAIEGLRKGAQALADQMQQQAGDQPGEGEGPGDPNGPMRQGRNNPNADPLGREQHDRRDNSRSLYDPLGVPAAQRAQRVLEELRRRLSDPARPREELDYLERLLRRY
jgi:uncharacterized protein (TIGR02302 family)